MSTIPVWRPILTAADLDRTLDFIAKCIAIGAGYTCYPGPKA